MEYKSKEDAQMTTSKQHHVKAVKTENSGANDCLQWKRGTGVNEEGRAIRKGKRGSGKN